MRPRAIVTLALLALVAIGVLAAHADAAPTYRAASALHVIRAEEPTATIRRCRREAPGRIECRVLSYVVIEWEEEDEQTGAVTTGVAKREGFPFDVSCGRRGCRWTEAF